MFQLLVDHSGTLYSTNSSASLNSRFAWSHEVISNSLLFPRQAGPHASLVIGLGERRSTEATSPLHCTHRHRQPSDHPHGRIGRSGPTLVFTHRPHSSGAQFLLPISSQPVVTGWRTDGAWTQNARCDCLKEDAYRSSPLPASTRSVHPEMCILHSVLSELLISFALSVSSLCSISLLSALANFFSYITCTCIARILPWGERKRPEFYEILLKIEWI